MKINLLEFKIKDNFFGIRTKYIKNIFDIEYIKEVPLMPDYVAGITSHGKHPYLLICLENLLGLSEKKCEDAVGKTAITVKVNGFLYSLIVDEIIKIEEIEDTGSGNDIVNFYKVKNIVLEELTPEFLKAKIKVPSLSYHKAIKDHKEEIKKDKKEETYLIFSLENKLFAIKTAYVKKVEYLGNLEKNIATEDDWIEGVYLIKRSPVKTGSLKKLLKMTEGIEEENLIIVEKDGKDFGFKADSIIDIYTIEESSINKGSDENAILKDFFVYNNKVVSVLSEKFILDTLEKYSLKKSQEKSEQTSEKKDSVSLLIVNILGEKFAVPMKNIDEVLEYDDIHMSDYVSENPFIKGLAVHRDLSFFVITLENLFGKQINTSDEDVRVLLIKDTDEKETGLLVNAIEDLITVKPEDIAKLEDENSITGGVVMTGKDSLVNLLNIKWLFSNNVPARR